MRAKQRRRKEAATEAAIKNGVDIHEVQVEEAVATAENDLADVAIGPLRTKVTSLEGLLKGEQKELNRLRCSIAFVEQAAAETVAQGKADCAKEIAAMAAVHALEEARLHKASENAFAGRYGDIQGQVAVTRDVLAEVVDDISDRLILGTAAIEKAVTEAIALRIETLPTVWSPKNIAQKVRDNDFEHPHNIRDYYPELDQNGFPIRIDGREVEKPEMVARKEKSDKIMREMKAWARTVHAVEAEKIPTTVPMVE